MVVKTKNFRIIYAYNFENILLKYYLAFLALENIYNFSYFFFLNLYDPIYTYSMYLYKLYIM